jgi:hypothetical protein
MLGIVRGEGIEMKTKIPNEAVRKDMRWFGW